MNVLGIWILIILGLMPSLSVASCAPEKWAEQLEAKLKCDMTLEAVQALTSRRVVAHEIPRFWKTHIVHGSSTAIELGFENGHLKFAQISWAEKMTRMASFQRIDLCGTAPPSADVVHRLPMPK